MRLFLFAMLFIWPFQAFTCPPEVDGKSPQAQGIYYLYKIDDPIYFKKIASFFGDSVKKKERHAQFVMDTFNSQIQQTPPEHWQDKDKLQFLNSLSEKGVGFTSLLIGAGYYDRDTFGYSAEGEKKRFAKREKYFRQAVEQGHLPALVPYAQHIYDTFLASIYVPEDHLNRAFSYIDKAISLGCPYAVKTRNSLLKVRE